ncbi:MAG: polysaccharide deacetylase family protein [Ginsengibacter sp.]
MILLLTDTITPRLQYIAEFIFTDNWRTEYSITTNKKAFKKSNAIKINYTADEFAMEAVNIQGSRLLFEKKIYIQNIETFETNGFTAFFKNKNGPGNFPFDVFAATFFLLTRYEEYLHHAKDKYGRYDHRQSLATTNGFLKIPLINYWLTLFAQYIKSKFSGFHITTKKFNFLPTYDVDIAFEWLHRGFIRNTGMILKLLLQHDYKKISAGFKILLGKRNDPFDNFKFLDQLHDQYNLQPLYFFLVSERNTKFDKNINPLTNGMQTLISYHKKKYEIGIHPSYFTSQNEKLLKEEKFLLEDIAGNTIYKSRQHYLRFNLPDTYRKLLDAGLKDEYSMGYGTINGFRASFSGSFYWYDIEREQPTKLRIHPFCYMDSNAIFHQKNTPAEALEELIYYYKACEKVNGTFISIIHNHLTGSDNLEWNNVYEKFLAEINFQT